jgi:hypothetical protein
MATELPPSVIEEKQKDGEINEPVIETGEVLNASGHAQELDRNFSLLAVCSVGITTGNTWAALGGSIVIAIYNGGPPGVIYEFLAVSVFYWCIAALLAELASSIPSSAGVYHWATVTGGKRWGRSLGFFAGWVRHNSDISSKLYDVLINYSGISWPGSLELRPCPSLSPIRSLQCTVSSTRTTSTNAGKCM